MLSLSHIKRNKGSMKTLKFLFYFALLGSAGSLSAQEDLLSLVEDSSANEPRKVYATFKTVRICNAQTIETVKKNHLDFRIAHRFGNIYNSDLPNAINNTFQTFFGFGEVSDVRFSLDYGLTEDITVGIGRSSGNRLLDGTIKWKILKQNTGKMPISLAFFSSLGYTHAPPLILYQGVEKDFETSEAHRFNYFTQIIIASKINEWLSLELLPSYIHRNYIKESYNAENGAADQNAFFSIGFGGRIKMSKRVSFIGDFFYNVAEYYRNNTKVYNPLALGFEIETGGHVFSLFFTNANFLVENNFIPETTDTWSKGQVKFGFTISRTFAL
jgi:hypothetical protein